MKIAVLYASMTGHSKKIAAAVSAALGVTAQNVKDCAELEKTDLLFLVGGIYADSCSKHMLKFAETLDGSVARRVALVTSSASQKHGQDMVREILMQNNVEVLEEEFMCGGRFLFMRLRHPNKTDYEAAAAYAVRIAESFKGA